MLSAIDKQLASVSSLRLISERSLMRQMLVVGWGFGLLLAVADFTFFAPFNWGDAITLPVASIAIVVSLITPVDRYASSW
ncbi:MAG: hypothetical protein JHC87_03175, partial [Thermoleophilaceae bacterium]|nr:hypothetical protein [Thermoleophilaceae bacterium]